MNAEVKRKWIEALQGGEYKQARKQLAVRSPDGEVSYCCLGVLCDLYRKEVGEGEFDFAQVDNLRKPTTTFQTTTDSEWGVPPVSVKTWAGLPEANPGVKYLDEYDSVKATSLAEANDAGLNFSRIAEIIKEQL